MKILFTTKNATTSKLIRSITEEPVSHCAIKLAIGVVVHSNWKGVHLEWASNFYKHNTVVYKLTPKRQPTRQRDKLERIKDRENTLYDLPALLFVGLALLARKYLKLPLPKSNLWQSSGMDMCTEFVTRYVDKEADSMITPYGLYNKLKNTGDWIDG